MPPGYVYLLINRSIPGLLKIRKTTRPPTERAEELSGPTGVPTPYYVVFESQVSDCDSAKRILHKCLSEFRVSPDREFFRIDVDEAIRRVEQLLEPFRIVPRSDSTPNETATKPPLSVRLPRPAERERPSSPILDSETGTKT